MRFGRVYVGTWDQKNDKFTYFENYKAGCGCRFITVFNFLIAITAKDCKP